MRRTLSLWIISVISLVLSSTAFAWNQGAKHVNALSFRSDGAVQFTLFNKGKGGAEIKCSGKNVFFSVPKCDASNHACIAAVNRMASLLLSAKVAGKAVHVQRDKCTVTEVVLKP